MAAAGNKGRYVSNANINHFMGERQISFQGTVGNTSANMSSSGGGGRGGRMDGSVITVSRMTGINFRNKWSKKISVYGSYNFSPGRLQQKTLLSHKTLTQRIKRKPVLKKQSVIIVYIYT